MFKIDGIVRLDEPMARHTSFRIGGPADVYAVPAHAREAALIQKTCAQEAVPCFLLGGGTNILVSDRGIRGVVLDLSRITGITVDGTSILARGGTPVSDVAEAALKNGLGGMEFAFSLPGSVAGAVWMNARCYEGEISDILTFVEHLDARFTPRRYEMQKADWAYKKSPFQSLPGAILSAGFRLVPSDPERISTAMQEHRRDRERKGHFLFPCAGSIFKNNRAYGAPTGKLIESLGLKGTRAGGAQVAPFHGNIIINADNARADDVRQLIELLEREVRLRLGFELEREVILVGDWA
jgi:UDP-N-acetylmuramate dehydrogenase